MSSQEREDVLRVECGGVFNSDFLEGLDKFAAGSNSELTVLVCDFNFDCILILDFSFVLVPLDIDIDRVSLLSARSL